MVSRTETRRTLRRALDKVKKNKKQYKFPMADFRHAIFETVDKCRLLIGCNWALDTDNEICTCNLFFKDKTISCSYNHKDKDIVVNEIRTVEQDSMQMDVMVSTKKCTCESLPITVYAYQPKIKVVIKKKC